MNTQNELSATRIAVKPGGLELLVHFHASLCNFFAGMKIPENELRQFGVREHLKKN